MTQKEINDICFKYCKNEMSKLKKLSYPLFIKFGGISPMDYDDFYSIAAETLFLAAKAYDSEKNDNFEAFLVDCIKRKFKTKLRDLNRHKNTISRKALRLDAPTGDDGSVTVGDLTEDPRFKDDYSEVEDNGFHKETNDYINKLSKKQKQILEMLQDGFQPVEIKAAMNITTEKYNMLVEDMTSINKIESLRYLICEAK